MTAEADLAYANGQKDELELLIRRLQRRYAQVAARRGPVGWLLASIDWAERRQEDAIARMAKARSLLEAGR